MHLNQDKPNSKKTQKKNQDLSRSLLDPFWVLGFWEENGRRKEDHKDFLKGFIERTWKDER